ncbi:MAG: PEP-CTERM sorting domain-containing protein [Massilia sp.]
MWIRLFFILLCSVVASCQARSSSYEFKFTGFERYIDDENLGFDSRLSLSGFFEASDNNGNHALELAEVRRFNWQGDEYEANSWAHLGCPYNYCQLERFSYKPGSGELQFATRWNYSDENGVSFSSGATTTGQYDYRYDYTGGPAGRIASLDWTDRTRLIISPPVPEPSAAALMLAGCLLITWKRRSGRRKTGPPFHRPAATFA